MCERRDEKDSTMRTNKLSILFIISTFFFSSVGTLLSQESEGLEIYQTDKQITIDGNLDEWTDVDFFPVNVFPSGKKIEPSPDISISAKFTYDSKNFYAAVEAFDDTFEFPFRSWRFGDGLYLTFVDPNEGNPSDRFYSFGFSLQEEKSFKVLVNRDGEYFPAVSLEDIEVKIAANEQNKSITYEISIPFDDIIPFKPFIHDRWGINLIYIDRDHGRRKIIQLTPDMFYDSEISKKRKGAIFRFVNHQPEKHEIQSSINAFHFYNDDEKILTCAINSPAENTDWKIRYIISFSSGNVSSEKSFSLKKGTNLLKFKLDEEVESSGIYVLSLGIIDDKDSLKYTADKQFFVLNREKFEKLNSRLIEIKSGKLFAEDAKFRLSIPTFEIRLKWIREFMDDSSPYADVSSIDEWFEELDLLVENIDEGKPTLFFPGVMARLAHRSEIDNTLQPYSVYVPDTYDEKYPNPLFVTLHGSGEDEQRAMFYVAQTLVFRSRKEKLGTDFIVMAPKARGLSDWYLGDSGKDVIECINHIKKLYNIDEKNIILDGFSMGGYGAWRLGLLYPELFKGLIIRSGAVAAPIFLKGERILDLLDAVKKLNVFIVHGDNDNSSPIRKTRMVVKKLEEMGIKPKYEEVKEASHGGYDKWEDIFDWLKKTMDIKKRDKEM